MKTTLTISFICFLILGFNGQSKGQNLTKLQKSKIEKQVDSIFQTMVKAAENVDYDKISLGVDDRHKAGFIVNNSYFTKYDSLINMLKTNSRSGTKQHIIIQNKKITVLSDNIVLLTASGETNIELATGQSFNIKFLWSFVYEKMNNDWKVIQSHQSRAN
ncbi:MAG TPA: nuclear transport factor 2 family protein [Bacteroidales bacterium]